MAATSLSKSLGRLGVSRVASLQCLPGHCIPPQPFFLSSSPVVTFSAESQPAFSFPARDNKRGPRWKWVLFLPGAITFGLGTWQIFRRQEKIKTLEYRKQRLGMEPMKLSQGYPSSDILDSLEFRKVVCKGVYDEAKSIFVGPRSRTISGVTENGYYLITPLIPIPNNPESVQKPILVNRGWVPRGWREKSLEQEGNSKQPLYTLSPSSPSTEPKMSSWKFWSKKPKTIKDQSSDVTPTEVVGVIRGSEKPSVFVPANDSSSSQWFYVDVPAIARASGLPENTIYIEDINENVNPSNPYPLPKDVNTLIRSSVMPQDHLNYTLTWYSLSAAVTFMAYKRLRPKRSRR